MFEKSLRTCFPVVVLESKSKADAWVTDYLGGRLYEIRCNGLLEVSALPMASIPGSPSTGTYLPEEDRSPLTSLAPNLYSVPVPAALRTPVCGVAAGFGEMATTEPRRDAGAPNPFPFGAGRSRDFISNESLAPLLAWVRRCSKTGGPGIAPSDSANPKRFKRKWCWSP